MLPQLMATNTTDPRLRATAILGRQLSKPPTERSAREVKAKQEAPADQGTSLPLLFFGTKRSSKAPSPETLETRITEKVVLKEPRASLPKARKS